MENISLDFNAASMLIGLPGSFCPGPGMGETCS